MTVPLLAAARAFAAAGCSVVPVRTDGTKAPAPFWKQQQLARANDDQLRAWFATDTYDGLGVVCGRVSGQLEMLEWEGRAVTDGLLDRGKALLADHGMTELWDRLTAGYVELTPSGGVHLLYRVDGDAAPNRKIARRPSTDNELAANPAQKVQVLIETRGEGGFTVTAPSHGRSHPTGKPWLAITGTAATIPTISVDERDALHAVLSLLDQMPVEDGGGKTSGNTTANVTPGDRPGDDYNVRASWADILTPHGWTVATRVGDGYGWRRPGKTGPGISATTGTRGDVDRLYVFSTSTAFDPEKPYSKFAAYALLEHGGDYRAAARALRADGYGAPLTLIGPTVPVENAQPRPALTVISETADKAQPVTLTDVGNAELLVQCHGHRVRYVPERGRWLRWGGAHWSWDDAGTVVELAKDTVLAMDSSQEALAKHRQRSLSRRAIDAMVALARTNPTVVAPAALLDADPYALCTPSGAVDLRTGTLGPAQPEDLHTRCTAVPCDPAMPTPRWQEFLADTFDGHPELAGFVQRLAGYSATGAVTHHVLPFLHGPGGNGKSVFLDVIRAVLGDYATSAPAKFLMAHGQRHDTEIARLSGVRFVICSEVNQEDRFDEAKVKLLTGGDALTANFMRQDHFTFTPTHHLWLMGNHQPKVSGGGESFWRRLRMVPFSNSVPDDRKIEGLDRILVEQEGPGILAWIVAGAADVLTGGLRAPESVMAATRMYADEEDALARFVDDRCLIGGAPEVRIDTGELRRAYDAWCRGEGEKPVSPQVFGRELRTRYGIEQTRSNGRRYYLGLALLPDDDDGQDESLSHWSDR